MDLFILRNKTPRIMKLVTDGSLQDDIELELRRQATEFLSGKEEISFDARYRPDDGEVLIIEDFDDIEGLIAAVKTPGSYDDWPATENDLANIKGIFGGFEDANSTTVIIQAFDRRQSISTRKISFWYDQDTFRRINGVGITFDTKPTAILTQEKGAASAQLYFVSLHNTRRLFDMDAYYHEITQDEVNGFFNNQNFHEFDQDWLELNIDNWIRKKITFINQEGILDACTPAVIRDAGLSLGITIDINNSSGSDKLVFPPDKKKLKELLRFLDEDIWESALSGSRFQSSSKRRLG
jgi:hypothetical protein